MCVIQIACVSLSALLAVNLQPTTVMPSKQQRARLKRLSRELQFDHPITRSASVQCAPGCGSDMLSFMFTCYIYTRPLSWPRPRSHLGR